VGCMAKVEEYTPPPLHEDTAQSPAPSLKSLAYRRVAPLVPGRGGPGRVLDGARAGG